VVPGFLTLDPFAMAYSPRDTIKGSGWASYVKRGAQPIGGAHNREPDRSPLKLGSDAPFFKDGKLNRDPHASPEGQAVIPSEAREVKEVHVYHHASRSDDD
jgi:hypothetical protein